MLWDYSKIIWLKEQFILLLIIAQSKWYRGEEGLAAHSSILAWRIPSTEELWWAKIQRATESDMTEVT